MSDIVKDAKEWLDEQPKRTQTHSENCHKWHLSCLVYRLLAEIARLREERRSISTLLGKVESLEADNERLREERKTWCTVDGYPGQFEMQPLPPGPEGHG